MASQNFYDACIKANIKPIFGMTVNVTDGLYTIETVVLAINNDGLRSLFQLSSAIKMKQKEVISVEWLKSIQQILQSYLNKQINLIIL